jgi:hypothetical protein
MSWTRWNQPSDEHTRRMIDDIKELNDFPIHGIL